MFFKKYKGVEVVPLFLAMSHWPKFNHMGHTIAARELGK